MSVPVTANDQGVVALSLWLVRYALRRWRSMSLVAMTMLIRIGLDLLRPWPMKVLIDNALDHQPLSPLVTRLVPSTWTHSAKEMLWASVVATMVLFLLSWMLTTASAMANLEFGQRLSLDLAADVFAHLQRLSMRFHHRKPVGDSIRRVTSDSACITTIVKDALLPAISSVAMLLIMFAVLWRLNWALALVSLAILPLLMMALRRYAQPMMDAGYNQQEIDGQMYSVLEQTLSAIPVVQAFTREEHADEQFRASTDASLSAALKATVIQSKFKTMCGFATALGTAAITGLGAWQALDGRLTIGDLLVFISYLGSLYGPLESLAYTSSTIHAAAGSARRVMEVLRQEPDVRDDPHANSLNSAQGHVRIENVTFGYEPGRKILHGVSLEAKPGQTIAIVGPTGAGKSTLVSLIPRFFDPWEGRVLIDGQDVRELRLKSLRSQVGIVLQEALLFPLTVAENIAYARPDAARDLIESAACAARAHDFIVQLPQGYDTVIGERGATLSGGERQRISIARALLKDAPVLVLDEPTSALDARTESLLVEALARLMKGRTTFIIAHRLSTIRNADQIVVIENGRVVQQGRHEELLKEEGLYRQMQSHLLEASS
jgi:ATP-binding cassette subfamily B protein